MKSLKLTSALLSAVMCVSMITAPVSVMADDTQAPSETETTETEEEKEPEKEEPEEESEPEERENQVPGDEESLEAMDAVASGKCGKKLKWSLDKNGTLKVTGKGSMYSYTTADNGLTFNRPWEKHISKIKKVVISKGVTTVGEYAFIKCPNLTSISLPKTLKIINRAAFSGNNGLKSVSIPKGVTTIAYAAFGSCQNLANVTISYGVTKIGGFAFYENSSLKSIVLPSSLKVIEGKAFAGCSSLEKVTMPASVQTIGDHAFSGCSRLVDVNIPISGLQTIGEYAFTNCSSLTKFDVPLSVTDLGDYAFNRCTSLEEVTLSKTLNDHLSAHVFDGCSNLSKPTVSKYPGVYEFLSDEIDYAFFVINPKIDGNGAVVMLVHTEVPERFVVPNVAACNGINYKVAGVVPASKSYFKNLKELVLGSNVVSLTDGNFEDCPELVSVTGGAGLVNIGYRAFANCPKLKTFNITSKKLNTIGTKAFYGDKLLKTLSLKKTTKLTKSGVKNSLKGSSVKTVKVKKSKVKKYKKIFKKKNSGKSVKVKK